MSAAEPPFLLCSVHFHWDILGQNRLLPVPWAHSRLLLQPCRQFVSDQFVLFGAGEKWGWGGGGRISSILCFILYAPQSQIRHFSYDEVEESQLWEAVSRPAYIFQTVRRPFLLLSIWKKKLKKEEKEKETKKGRRKNGGKHFISCHFKIISKQSCTARTQRLACKWTDTTKSPLLIASFGIQSVP